MHKFTFSVFIFLFGYTGVISAILAGPTTTFPRLPESYRAQRFQQCEAGQFSMNLINLVNGGNMFGILIQKLIRLSLGANL